MNYIVREGAPNVFGLPARVLAVLGYVFDEKLTTPLLDNACVDQRLGIVSTTVDNVIVPLTTVDELVDALSAAANALRLNSCDRQLLTHEFFTHLEGPINDDSFPI